MEKKKKKNPLFSLFIRGLWKKTTGTWQELTSQWSPGISELETVFGILHLTGTNISCLIYFEVIYL